MKVSVSYITFHGFASLYVTSWFFKFLILCYGSHQSSRNMSKRCRDLCRNTLYCQIWMFLYSFLSRSPFQIEITPNRKQYIGKYAIVSPWIPEVIVNITEDCGLLFTQTPSSLGFSYLRSIRGHEFEISYRSGLECSVYGMGQNRERVIFDPPSESGQSLSLKFGPFIFKRTLPHRARKASALNSKLSPSGLL